MSHKSSLQVPTPAVIKKTNKHGSQKVSNQQRNISGHCVWYDEANKLLQNEAIKCQKYYKDESFILHVG